MFCPSVSLLKVIFFKIWLEKEQICKTHFKHGGQNTDLQSMDYP